MKNLEIVAHRGMHKDFPENTIQAFEDAIFQGADAVEFDVRLSADEVPVIFHYYYLDQLTTLTGPVFKYTYQQLRQAKFKHSPYAGGAIHIPSLAEVLNQLTGRIGLEIEIKGPEPEAPGVISNLLCDYRHAWDNIEITSYEPLLLVEVRENCPGIATDLLIPRGEPWMGSDVLTYQVIQRARLSGARAVHLHPAQLTRQVVKQICSAGIEVHAWDVNTDADWDLVYSLDINKINTDNLKLILSLSGRR